MSEIIDTIDTIDTSDTSDTSETDIRIDGRAYLLCDMDFHVAEVGGDGVGFERTQTIMKGAEQRDFRYRFKSGGYR